MNESFLIGLAGGSGSGKTTFLKDLQSHFSEDQLTVVTCDNYYLPRTEQQPDGEGVLNFDLPTSLNLDLLAKDLSALKKGESIQQTEYTFNNAAKEPKKLTLKSAPVIIAEGLFVFHHPSIANVLDYKVFFYADADIRLERRIQRDSVERGYPESDVRYRWKNHVRPADLEFLEPYEASCEMIINNNKNYEVGLRHLRQLIESKL
ncbi:MAG: uridine kinase [Flavobacteriales bacterium]|nr:uridine kinase [Flavobacteriales bacterium]